MSKIEQVRNLSASARVFLWEIMVPQVPGAVGTAAETLTLRARTASFPGMSIESSMSYFKGHTIKHPGRREYPRTIAFRFEEGLDLSILNALKGWFDGYRDEITGVGGGEAATKVEAFVRLLNYNDEVIGRAHLYGVYPENVPDVPLDYGSGDLVSFEVTFSYDFWVLD